MPDYHDSLGAEFYDSDRPTPVRWQGAKETVCSQRRYDPPVQIGDEVGHFVVEHLLGYGSSGFVYRATDQQTGHQNAIKILRLNNQDDVLQNRHGFRRMMSIDHPNLVKVDQIYQFGDQTCLAMEEVSGVTFARKMKQLMKMPKQEAFDILAGLLRDFGTGLAVMHANGLVHRDIKPHNLMVDSNGRGKIIDFGLVDHFHIDQQFEMDGWIDGIQFGSRVGTPRYYAPEVIWSKRYLPSGDIFALGVVFTESLNLLASETQWQPNALEPSTPDPNELDPNELEISTPDPNALDPNALDLVDAPEVLDSDIQGNANELRESLVELTTLVPDLIHDACVSMLDRHPSERPTAMRIARLGMPPGHVIDWPEEDVLVGRSRELEMIKAWVDDIFDGKVSRLHISGVSGIGKTRLIEEAIRYIESQRWGQVFFGRCRAREDAPLQAFMQICDLIAHRYGQSDRDPIKLDYVSARVICQSFPVMGTIVTSAIRPETITKNRVHHVEEPQDDSSDIDAIPTRHEALDAAIAICDRLRDLGPLFLLIDDTQWADRDSLNVLDHLRNSDEAGNGLGMLTLSRRDQQRQKVPADQWIQLKKLNIEQGVQVLQLAADRNDLVVDPSELLALSAACDGSPFRLQEVAEEFCPGGLLSSEQARSEFLSDVDPADPSSSYAVIDRFWRRRAGVMSDEAKRLLPLVAAGGKVSTAQLAKLSGLGDAVDAVISQLHRGRLIVDEATGGECISIFHDRVADQLIAGLSESEKRKAHLDWANLLISSDDPSHATRIAGHLFAADRPRQAVHFAILAAEKAELLVAKTESGRWYKKAADHTEGDEKTHLLGLAAKAYHEADQPSLAAKCYLELADLTAGQERRRYQELAVILNIQSGRFSIVRQQLAELATHLNLPLPKPAIKTYASLAIGMARLKWMQRNDDKGNSFAAVAQRFGIGTDCLCDDELTETQRANRRRLNLCNQLARPLSMFYALYSAELNVTAAGLVKELGTDEQRLHVAVGESVFGCYQPGRVRQDSEERLAQMVDHLPEIHSIRSRGDVWSGLVCAHAMSCRWNEIDEPLDLALAAYREQQGQHSFEIAHTHWIGLWADWNLGNWSKMVYESDLMIEDSIRRNDLHQQMVTCGGYGAGAFLAGDRADALNRYRCKEVRSHAVVGHIECVDVLDQMAEIHVRWYEGRFADAWHRCELLEKSLKRFQMQFIRVIQKSLSALAALHQMKEQNSLNWKTEVLSRIKHLRLEKLPQAIALADFYEGLLLALQSSSRSDVKLADGELADAKLAERAKMLLEKAADQAAQQGLKPLQLAAIDAISQLPGGSQNPRTSQERSLLRLMRDQGVVFPEKLARLYTIDLEPIS
ncbi:Serine/threonine-protein kinase StkP [Rubripirellula obstinata]|uniref:Serine/threonine-protein kinase StkP n=1 Tax=Rubripirellula obstinata TaxID=406547 RepID=A0A5B1CPH8_9BACT|nr:serine/threonine-protein kinase [Rubripirellula obstinata]KAA1262466.1 Serine/threonine-protein kinase StkP [Rubripirellula obstinata]